ncbi:MAG: ERF family protein [Chitinophagaceae bacterium]
MEKSQSIKNIASAIILFHVKVDTVKKDASNPFFKSKYATLSNILDVINVPLNESGLSFAQFPTGENGLTTILMHAESGEYLQANYEMHPVKNDPQGRGSSITYQRRYALAAILGLNIDDDDDGNAASHSPNTNSTTDTHKNSSEDNRPWLNKTEKDKVTLTKEWKQVVAALGSGVRTIEQVKAAYKISKDNLIELTTKK